MNRRRLPAEYIPVQDDPALFDAAEGWREHWVGMPEFVQVKQREYAKIIVRFRNQDDLDAFASLIGQKLNKKSQATWFPELVVGYGRDKKYIAE